MPDELLQRFSRTYAPGAVICREGEEGDEMYIIQAGKVRVSKRFAGKTHVISVLEKGDFFGEMAIVNRIQRTATVTAIDDVELLVFDREGLQNMIARNTRIALTIIDKLCRRLQNAHLKIQHLVKRDAEGLIALHLSSLYQELPSGLQARVPTRSAWRKCRSASSFPWRKCGKRWTTLGQAGMLGKGRETRFASWTARSSTSITEAVGKEPAGST